MAAKFSFVKSEFQQQTEDWNYETVGVFGKLPAMQGKKVCFTKRNLKGENRVTLQIFPKKYDTLKEAIEADDVEKLSCTTPLSKIVRKALAGGVSHTKMLSYLVTLEIQQDIDEPSKYFLFQEKGDGEALPAMLVSELKEKVSLDELVAF